MNVRLVRTETSAEGTFGKLIVDGRVLCVTGELPAQAGDPDVENERGTDCIPAGVYECQLRQSPKFGRVYEVRGVPDRSLILIHKGNFCGDKRQGYSSDVEGCILLGMRTGILENQKVISQSREAFEKFMMLMAGRPFTLSVEWENADA